MVGGCYSGQPPTSLHDRQYGSMIVADGPGGRWNPHGLTATRYALMLAGQDGGCAICGVPEQVENGRSNLVIDHDHRCCPGTGRKKCGRCVRGLLCNRCNSRLAALEDSVFLDAASRYLAGNRAVAAWCRKGHRLEPMPSGACRACARIRARAYYARKVAAQAAARQTIGGLP